MFVVNKFVDSKNGLLYQVRDANAKFVNTNKKINGEVGLHEANNNVVFAYYSTKNVNLTSKAKHYNYGTKLRVISQKAHNLTMRYKLNNGTYISANKKPVVIYR